MPIQWYPGHMHKAGKEIRQVLPRVDLVIEVLDARIPFSSENPMLTDLRGDKPCIKLLNKSDLADPQLTQLWLSYLERQQSVNSVAIHRQDRDGIRALPGLCRQMAPDRGTGLKGIRTMIVGIPNVGKSTLINLLAGRSIARTGNEPAVTKSQQRINLHNGIMLYDTPGVMWPNVENRNSGYRLAATGAIRETAMEYDDVACFAAEYLLDNYAENLQRRYRIEELPRSGLELLEVVGGKRGCLRPGGRVDLPKAAKLFLMELRSGKLGRITLETPAMMERELAELAMLREQKAARKARRRTGRRREEP
ncbi:MAG: ribosome biogenesis GTPase YlqF [Pseudomonadota bacterium]